VGDPRGLRYAGNGRRNEPSALTILGCEEGSANSRLTLHAAIARRAGAAHFVARARSTARSKHIFSGLLAPRPCNTVRAPMTARDTRPPCQTEGDEHERVCSRPRPDADGAGVSDLHGECRALVWRRIRREARYQLRTVPRPQALDSIHLPNATTLRHDTSRRIAFVCGFLICPRGGAAL